MSPLSLSISKCRRPSSSKPTEREKKQHGDTQDLNNKECTAWLNVSDHSVHNWPVTIERMTVPFSPASKSLANMFVTKDPAGRPAQIWDKERDRVSYTLDITTTTTSHFIARNNISTWSPECWAPCWRAGGWSVECCRWCRSPGCERWQWRWDEGGPGPSPSPSDCAGCAAPGPTPPSWWFHLERVTRRDRGVRRMHGCTESLKTMRFWMSVLVWYTAALESNI